MAKKESVIEIEHWPIENLTPYELNVKKHGREQVAAIAKAISKYGFDQPIVVDRNGVIIKGHGRRLAAIELGWKTVPVWHRKDLSGEEARAARLADNRVAISDIDTEMLRVELSTLEIDMSGIFDDKEMIFLKADLGLINTNAFVNDMAAILAGQRQENDDRIERLTGVGTRVPVAKAFGFKDIASSGQLTISKLMARAEALTGLQGDAAMVAYFLTLESVSNE